MLPRNPADYRTLLWLLFMPAVAAISYVRPDLALWLVPLGCYLAAAAGVIAHNHNHCPTFSSKRANAAMSIYLSIFYGYPTFAWVPTHNANHHKFVNGPGDATITWRHTNSNNMLVAFTYFFVSAYHQSDPIKEYIAKAKAKNPALYRQIITQYVVWAGTHLSLFALALTLHGPKTGTIVFVCALAIPAFYALWMIMMFNYMQHVHADPWSEYNHSRNYVGKLFNFLMFNNGYHTAHHENAGTHWSKLSAIHETLAPHIHPDLQPKSFVWWMVRRWVLAPVMPSMRSVQIGRAGFDVGNGKEADITTAEVDALEAGMNAEIAR
jgi:beta-carotene hydroxylase